MSAVDVRAHVRADVRAGRRFALGRRVIRAQRRTETILWLCIYMGSVYVAGLLAMNPPVWP